MEEPHTALPPPESTTVGPIEVAPNPVQHTENTMALRSSEKASQTIEVPTTSPSPTSISPVGQPMPATQAPIPSGQNAQTVPISSAALAADDADLIEKEWVERAKAIIAHTSHDPRRQNHEINKIKADYIKKRYNKDIKIQEA